MLCEKCQKNPATVHMEKIVNNTKTEFHLCYQCAIGIDADISFDSIIKGFLSSVIEQEQAKGQESGEEPAAFGTVEKGPVCGRCGMTYEAFRAEGKLGCSQCYKFFRPQLESVIRNVQGGTEHTGKLPNKLSAQILYKREIENLKKLLREAVEQEEYETAANIRDQIRSAESKGAQ